MDYQTWKEREEPHRIEPDSEKLNAFVSTQLCEETRDLPLGDFVNENRQLLVLKPVGQRPTN
jgi:hypothetical protein